MSVIKVIALNTFKENIRNRVLYVIIAIALLLVGFAVLLGEWSVFNKEYVIKSFSLSVLSISGLLLSIFIGVGLVQKEIQKKTVYTILTKPVHRASFIIGKYVGLIYIALCHITILSTAIAIVLWTSGGQFSLDLCFGVFLKGVEMALIIAMALFFSTIASPALSSFFTFGLYIAGHVLPEVIEQIAFTKKVGSESYSPVFESVIHFFQAVLPNLSMFDKSSEIVHSLPLNFGSVLVTGLYGVVYIFIFLSASIWWFNKKEFV